MATMAASISTGAANVHLAARLNPRAPTQVRQHGFPGIAFFKQCCRRKQCLHAQPASSAPSESPPSATEELDRFIDRLRSTDSQELPKFVAENVLSFDQSFWIRLAERTEACTNKDDREDFEEVVCNLQSLVERTVLKAEEKIETSTEVLLSVIAPVTDSLDHEIEWPPRDPEALKKVREELVDREKCNRLGDAFVSEVHAQLRQADKDKDDKPGLLELMRKVTQLYASVFLSKKSFAYRDGAVNKAEELLEKIISVENEQWPKVIKSGVTLGGGEVEPEELIKMTKKRIQRILLRTENGSYRQRVLVEYLKEIQKYVEALKPAEASNEKN